MFFFAKTRMFNETNMCTKSIFIMILLVSMHCDYSLNKERFRSSNNRLNGRTKAVLFVVPRNHRQIRYLRNSMLMSTNVDFWTAPQLNRKCIVMVKPAFRASFQTQLRRQHLKTRVLIPDVEKKIRQIKKIGLMMRSLNNGFFSDYQSIKSIYNFLESLAKQNPRLVRMMSIGKSVEQRDLRVIKIGSNAGAKPKPIIWIDACIHAREWIACATACFVISQLIAEYKARHKVTVRLLDKFDFYIMPVANPDGYEYSRTHNRLWRKNRSQQTNVRCIGVDLNRNYNFQWNTTGTSGNPCSEVYPGPRAASEPETIAMANFIWKYRNLIKCYVSFHAFGQFFMYPWGWSTDIAPDGQDLYNKALIATKALKSLYNTKYTVGGSGYLMYEASGASDDWAYGKAGIKYSYTIELRDEGNYGFLLPPTLIEPTGRETYVAIRTLANEISKEIF